MIADDWIALRTPQTTTTYEPGTPLRRVEVELPDGERLIFLTNHLGLGPTTIARIYKDALLRMNLFVYRVPLLSFSPSPCHGLFVLSLK